MSQNVNANQKNIVMKKVILSVFIACASLAVFAEKTDSKAETKSESTVCSLSGNIIDEISGEALVGVEVKVDGSDIKTYTDFDGHFVINNLKSGDCKLVASYTSYNKAEKNFKVDLNNNKVKIELQASK